MLRSSRQSVAAGHRVAPAVTTYKRDLAADPLQEQGGIIVDTIVAQTRQLDRFLAPSCLRHTLPEQDGNLPQRSSSMLLNPTAATHRQQP